MYIYFNGLLLGLSLIMALGPQNIFLIRQGVLRRHAALSALTCFISDLILITASIVGLQDILASHDNLRISLTWFGALFLLYYGISALKRSRQLKGQETLPTPKHLNRWQIVMLALGFSLLNPHAIIDSLVLIGGRSGQFPGYEHVFLLGVLSSSFLWFTVLTFTAYYFSKLLTQGSVWRRIEFSSGILMIALSFKLVLNQLIAIK